MLTYNDGRDNGYEEVRCYRCKLPLKELTTIIKIGQGGISGATNYWYPAEIYSSDESTEFRFCEIFFHIQCFIEIAGKEYTWKEKSYAKI